MTAHEGGRITIGAVRRTNFAASAAILFFLFARARSRRVPRTWNLLYIYIQKGELHVLRWGPLERNSFYTQHIWICWEVVSSVDLLRRTSWWLWCHSTVRWFGSCWTAVQRYVYLLQDYVKKPWIQRVSNTVSKFFFATKLLLSIAAFQEIKFDTQLCISCCWFEMNSSLFFLFITQNTPHVSLTQVNHRIGQRCGQVRRINYRKIAFFGARNVSDDAADRSVMCCVCAFM
jgi:hypothetical protein